MKTHKSHPNLILSPVSLGEIIDKITILKIKQDKMRGEKLKNVSEELYSLEEIIKKHNIQINEDIFSELKNINSIIWEIEDQMRLKENQKIFDNSFIQLARLAYKNNDKRASIKRQINETYNSKLIEEKSYPDYNK